MRGGRRALLVQYLRALVALVLVFTSAMASYAHAACPHTPGVQVDAVQTLVMTTLAEHGEHQGHPHDRKQGGKAHASCGDGICHGGCAVLGTPATLHARADVAAEAVIATISIQRRISSFERPPRASVLA
jgi:hypothetical protein